MTTPLSPKLPSNAVMCRAFYERDASFDGTFFTGVTSTRIFCRPTCTARKPKPENIEFFATPSEAMFAGYRACLRCKPMDTAGERPPLVAKLVQLLENDPSLRLREADLSAMGIDASTARRQFLRYFGMTFQAYSRARRMGAALVTVRSSTTRKPSVIEQQLEAGFESSSGYRDAVTRLFGAPPSRLSPAVLLFARWLETPLGAMLVLADDAGIHVLDFVNRRGLEREISRLRARLKCVIVPGSHRYLDQAEREIREYYAGHRQTFTLPLAPRGTPFQREVWAQLLAIPMGQTRSYSEIAVALGRPTAVRAVARANGDNYRGIIIPCHRVIGADGTLTGYGGGLARKQWLLDFERRVAQNG